MKKILLLMLMLAMALSSQAASNYGINVAGVEVSSSNYNNVTGGNINGGTVKYDPNNKILTLTNVSISRTGGDNYGIHNRSVDGLTIRFTGTSNITCDKANALHLDKSTTVSITGTLNAKMSAGENFGRGVIYVNDNATVWFQGGGTLNVTGNMKSGGSQSSCGICGFEGKGKTSSSVLNFSNLNVVMNVTNYGVYKFRTVNIHSGDVKNTCDYSKAPLYDVGGFNLNNGVACVTPADETSFNSSTGVFTSNSTYTHFTASYGVIISAANFPNVTFRSIMRSRCSYDGSSSIREEYLTTNELMNLTSLNLNNQFIDNLTGVGLLTYLTTLYCSNNWLTSLPTLPYSLKTLDCSYNDLTSLGSLPSGLQELNCEANELKSVTINGYNALKKLVMSSNPKLTSLNCSNNALTTLRIGDCLALTSLNCSNNKFSSLDISNLKALKTLDVSSNASLNSLTCYRNALTSLSITGCSALTSLDCSFNELTSLPTLPNSLQTLKCGSNKFGGTLTLTNHSALTFLDVSKSTTMTRLECYSNALTHLNVTGCSALTYLNCNANQLTTLVPALASLPTSLQTISCSSNKLNSLSLTGLSALKTLDVSYNTDLTTLNCYSNGLTSLNISGCTSLSDLQCYRNELSSLNVQGLQALKKINAFSNNLTSLSVEGCSALNYLNIRANQIKESAMTTLINTMRTIPSTKAEGTFYVYGENYSGDKPEGNVITLDQANAARAKRWLP